MRPATDTAECDLVETRIELNRGPPGGVWGIERGDRRGAVTLTGARGGEWADDTGAPPPDGVVRVAPIQRG